jgi:Flp pilus assembly protein TadD
MARRLRRSRIVAHQPVLKETREQSLVRRAHRYRRRGEHRQAMLALREACHDSGQSARLWTLYAVACVRVRRVQDAKQALRQALWLRERDRDEARARVMRCLIDRLEQHDDRHAQLPLRAA